MAKRPRICTYRPTFRKYNRFNAFAFLAEAFAMTNRIHNLQRQEKAGYLSKDKMQIMIMDELFQISSLANRHVKSLPDAVIGYGLAMGRLKDSILDKSKPLATFKPGACIRPIDQAKNFITKFEMSFESGEQEKDFKKSLASFRDTIYDYPHPLHKCETCCKYTSLLKVCPVANCPHPEISSISIKK